MALQKIATYSKKPFKKNIIPSQFGSRQFPWITYIELKKFLTLKKNVDQQSARKKTYIFILTKKSKCNFNK